MVFGINNDIFTNEIRKFKVELQFFKVNIIYYYYYT